MHLQPQSIKVLCAPCSNSEYAAASFEAVWFRTHRMRWTPLTYSKESNAL